MTIRILMISVLIASSIAAVQADDQGSGGLLGGLNKVGDELKPMEPTATPALDTPQENAPGGISDDGNDSDKLITEHDEQARDKLAREQRVSRFDEELARIAEAEHELNTEITRLDDKVATLERQLDTLENSGNAGDIAKNRKFFDDELAKAYLYKRHLTQGKQKLAVHRAAVKAAKQRYLSNPDAVNATTVSPTIPVMPKVNSSAPLAARIDRVITPPPRALNDQFLRSDKGQQWLASAAGHAFLKDNPNAVAPRVERGLQSAVHIPPGGSRRRADETLMREFYLANPERLRIDIAARAQKISQLAQLRPTAIALEAIAANQAELDYLNSLAQ